MSFDGGITAYNDGPQVAEDQSDAVGLSHARDRRVFREFLHAFRVDDQFYYRDQLRGVHNLQKRSIEVRLEHISKFNPDLHQSLLDRPAEMMPLFELAAADEAKMSLAPGSDASSVKSYQVRGEG